MTACLIVDTGALLAYLDRSEEQHRWVREVLCQHAGRMQICEAVLSEVVFLLARNGFDHQPVFDLIEVGGIECTFRLGEHWREVREFMTRYANLPMSLADACLVRMAELEPRAQILTLDRHFKLYRTRDRRVLRLRMPPERKP